MIEKIVLALIVLILLSVTGIVYMFMTDKAEACEARGGVLVRTFTDMKCVEAKELK